MALTAPQQAEVNKLKAQIADLKQTVMNTKHCTMGGFGNYLFDAFKKIEDQVKKIEQT